MAAVPLRAPSPHARDDGAGHASNDGCGLLLTLLALVKRGARSVKRDDWPQQSHFPCSAAPSRAARGNGEPQPAQCHQARWQRALRRVAGTVRVQTRHVQSSGTAEHATLLRPEDASSSDVSERLEDLVAVLNDGFPVASCDVRNADVIRLDADVFWAAHPAEQVDALYRGRVMRCRVACC